MVTSFLTICSIYLTASGGVDEHGLYGHWKFDNGNGVVEEIEYTTDHLFRGDIVDKGIVAWKFAGVWRLDNDQLKAIFTESSDPRFPPGLTDTDIFVELSENSFSIRNQGGQIHRYDRVK